MAKVRVFTNPDGSVRILHLNQRIANTTANLDRETAKDPSLVRLPHIDIEENAVSRDRANRHKWRIRGNAVIPDNTIPDLPDPSKSLLDEVDSATNIADLKAVLNKVIKRGSPSRRP